MMDILNITLANNQAVHVELHINNHVHFRGLAGGGQLKDIKPWSSFMCRPHALYGAWSLGWLFELCTIYVLCKEVFAS